ncbi:clathrin adaptor complex small chain [Calycina marina]|uniref:Coatomer subunit zeta n=1 Tax=Calycina marina TaxID=1763456 RepID=A0A9P8CGW3_9HELO|nr:clathrin adaptor complex small chain [Calycina marina]
MAPGMSLISVNAIIILSTEGGERVFAKYYKEPHATLCGHSDKETEDSASAYPDLKSQKAFEAGLFAKTVKQNADIILYDNRVVLYKSESNVMLYVVGSVDENEIMLYNVILSIRDTLHLLFKQTVDRSTITDNYDLVALAMDEIVDDGIILETDPTIVVTRISRAPTHDVAQLRNIDLSEQGLNNLASLGKSKFGEWLRQGL